MSETNRADVSHRSLSVESILTHLELGSQSAFTELTLADFERIVSGLPDCVWSAEISPAGIFRYRYLSPLIERFTGYPQESFLGGPEFWMSLVVPEDLPRLQAGVEKLLSLEHPENEILYRIIRRDGARRWVRDSSSVVRNADGSLTIDAILSDITDRVESEEQLHLAHSELDERVRQRSAALAESEQLFRQLAESITEVFWVTTPDKSQMIYISPAYETVFGRSCASLYETPRSFLDAIHPDDVERVRDALPGQIRGDFDVEYRVIRADGTQRWVRSRAFPILNSRKEVYRIAGLVLDITDRHLAAERLRESERLHRTLLDRHVDGVSLVADGRVIYVNPAICEITGYSEAELLQIDPFTLLQPEDRPLAAERMKALFAGGPESVNEYRYIRPDGGTRYLEFRSRAISYLGQASLLSFARDITEIKANEDKIRFLAMIVRHSNDAITGATMDGTIVSWNPAAERMFGYPAEEIIGKSVSILIPPGREHELPEALSRIERGESVHSFLTERLHRCGRLIRVSLTVSSILNSSGQIVGASAIIRDITEQLKEEQARKKMEAMCESLVSTAPDLILIMDVDGTIRYINRVSQATSVEAVIGRKTFDYLHPDSHEAARDALRQVWDTGEFVTRELRGYGADGTWRWYESRHGALRQDGKTIGVTVISTDITDRKEAEKRLLAEDRMFRKFLEQRERERELIAHEVHEGFIQDIVGAKFSIEALLHCARLREEGLLEELQKIGQTLTQAVSKGQRLIRELGPLILEHQGLLDALRDFIELEVEDGVLQIEFKADLDDANYAPLLKGTIFNILQEALNNVTRHSHATNVQITIQEQDQRLSVEVVDDGVGFTQTPGAIDQLGLLAISQRARMFGGQAQITSSPGAGTRVAVDLPIVLDRPPLEESE